MFSFASNKNDVRKRWSYEHIIKHKIMVICIEKEENNIFNETNERVTNKKKNYDLFVVDGDADVL